MTLREAFEKASTEGRSDLDTYQRIFELMHGRLPSDDEREMIRRRCLWFESDQAVAAA